MTDPVTVRKDDFLSAGRVQYRVNRSGLVGATLNGVPVLGGSFGPVNCDALFNAADGADKIGAVGSYRLDQKAGQCTVYKISGIISIVEHWTFGDEDAMCELKITNDGPDTIHYPGYGDLVATFPATPTAGVTTDSYWNKDYIQYCGRSILTPSFFLRIRASHLVGGNVGVSVCPLDLGDERGLVWWEAVGDAWATYTHRSFRCIWDRPIPPGESRTMRVALRVSDNVDPRHLLEPYRGAK